MRTIEELKWTREFHSTFLKAMANNGEWEILNNDYCKASRIIIDTINEVLEHREASEHCTDCAEYDKENYCCHRWSNVINEALEELKEEHRWIPVEERLPEEDGEYIVWVGEHGVNPVTADWYNCDIHEWERWYGVVTAWMPLPEAYKGEDK